MLTKTPHLFDDATKVTAGDSRWQGHTSPDYWAFVGPFGGATAATILRALVEHPQRSGATPFEQTRPYPKIAVPWVKQYDFRFVEGEPVPGKAAAAPSSYSKLWIADHVPRKIDALSLTAMSDAFFARIFHAKRELVPF